MIMRENVFLIIPEINMISSFAAKRITNIYQPPPFIQRANDAIYQINHYAVDGVVFFALCTG